MLISKRPPQPGIWYRSVYWRIALGFVLFLAALLGAQAVLFLWLAARAENAAPAHASVDVAAVVSSDLGAALAENPALDGQAYLRSRYRSVHRPIIVALTDGRVWTTEPVPPPPGLVRFALNRAARRRAPGVETGAERPPRRLMAFAPLGVGDRVIGSVIVLPDRFPGRMFHELGPVMAVAGLILLAAGTTLSSILIFRPVHRRLRALEGAARRLGMGDTTARATEEGGDEIAAVARAFNSMASDLAARARELEAADHTRRQLLADVSHELMTPLTAIRGYVETLAMPELSLQPATARRYLGIVLQELLRVEQIIGDLLDLARLEAGGPAFSATRVSVPALFARVIERHERACAEKGVRLTSSVAPAAETLTGDPIRLEQALQNLASNALRHTPAGGEIELRAEPGDGPGSPIHIMVSDTGDGIPPEHLPRIFDRFYKADSSRSEAEAGSGLGLSIVRAIVERHGGSISAVSRTDARTTFEIVLPHRDQSS